MKIKMIETFSGIGAQHKALENLKSNKIIDDYEVLATSDWDVYSVVSYAAIHYPGYESKIRTPTDIELNKWLIEYKDSLSKDGNRPLTNVNKIDKDILISWYKAFVISKNFGSIINSFDRVKKYLVDANLLTYSFPCTDLSTAGNFHGFNEGITKKTRSGLLFEIEKVLEQAYENDKSHTGERERERERLLPKFLLLENVPNLVSKQHKHSFDKWLKKLTSFGYETHWGVINSHDYGMIQARKRVYGLSILTNKQNPKPQNDLSNILKKIYESSYQPSWNQKKEGIEKLVDFKNKNIDESLWAHIKDTPSRLRMIDKSPKINSKTTKTSTVTTKQDRLPCVGSVEFNKKRKDKNGVRYTNRRFVTPMETYKMMGFNENDYKRAKTQLLKLVQSNTTNNMAREKLWKQAGNSIAVNVLEMIFYFINTWEL